MMTCIWQYPALKNDETPRLCGKEGHPFCKQHEFIREVLAETESVTREMRGHRETALTQWQVQVQQFRLLSEEANQLTPSLFVKRVHELLPELRRAAMEAVVYTYVTRGRKADQR